MKKLLLISLMALSALSTYTSVNAARPTNIGSISIGPTGPVYVNRYWGKFSYESTNGQYQYIKIVGGNTLQACQQAYFSAMGHYQSSPIWNFTGHILFCQSH